MTIHGAKPLSAKHGRTACWSVVLTVLLACQRVTLSAASLSPGPGGVEAGAAQRGQWTQIFSADQGELGGRGFCKPVMLPSGRVFLWGTPGKGKDWNAGAFDIDRRRWIPLPPRGNEPWISERPKMRYGMRWGSGTLLDPDSKQPIPVCHFNQAAYVPMPGSTCWC